MIDDFDVTSFDVDDITETLDELGVDIDSLTDFELDDDSIQSKWTKPILSVIPQKMVKWANAAEAAKQTTIGKGERIIAILGGRFVFGDFVCSYLTEHNAQAVTMTINVLSLSASNLFVLRDLMQANYIKHLRLVTSAFFYLHNRAMVEQIADYFEGLNFEFAICNTHCKIVTFQTLGGKFISMYGSANLRSSSSIEQITLEEGKDVYDFFDGINNAIFEKYALQRTPLTTKETNNALNIKQHE